jgi:hypothetical protein
MGTTDFLAVAKEVYTIYMHKGIEDSGYYAGTNT